MDVDKANSKAIQVSLSVRFSTANNQQPAADTNNIF